MRATSVRHAFVDVMPDQLQPETLYVCIPCATVAHLCLCGCGHEVVTPLSPTDWRLIFDGSTVSLDPSIGNWSYPCQSHYWVSRNRVCWAGRWSAEQIQRGRQRDLRTKQRYYDQPGPSRVLDAERVTQGSWRSRIARILRRVLIWRSGHDEHDRRCQ